MTDPTLSRRNFLKTAALAGAGLSLASAVTGAGEASPASGGALVFDPDKDRPRRAGQKPVSQLMTNPRERVRIGVIGLHRGMSHVRDCIGIEFVDIIAVCDIREDRTVAAAELCAKAGQKRPATYFGTDHVWEQLVEREDIDVVYVATPWGWHLPMCLRAMQHGKHAFVEVAASTTVNDCWQLVDASESTQRHCVMLENCCYGENELFVLNLARQGVFGTLTHAEAGYLHDLRQVLYELGSEGDWRRNYHWQMDGNLYPTHGLGPVAQYLSVGRGDRFTHLASMSSIEAGLTEHRDETKPNGGRHAAEKYTCGDVNTSILKTALGRTIILQHDVVSPRPYSRINALYGTRATFFDYPARLAIDQPARYGLDSKGAHEWLGEADMAKMRGKFTHPLWRQLAKRASASGHGGMDFVMNYRHLDCIRRGVTPDSDVYDAATWSCIVQLSTLSVAAGSMPVRFPDFTRGLWKTMRPVGIAEMEAKQT